MTTSENKTEVTSNDKQQSAIDKALAKAKARQAAKAENKPAETLEGTETPTEPKAKKVKAPKTEKPAKEPKVKKAAPDPKVVEAEKAAKAAARAEKNAAREAAAAAAKAERDVIRAAKKALKALDMKPAHMSKVEKAGAKLPKMDAATQTVYDLATTAGLTESQRAILVSHLSHLNRLNATVHSRACKFEVGQSVEIVSADRDARLIGLKGTITQVRKIRVLVDVGAKRPAYLFLSDIAPCAAEGDVEPQFLSPEVESPGATGTDNA